MKYAALLRRLVWWRDKAVKPLQRVRGLSVGLSKALVSRLTITVMLATAVSVGTGGCLFVPFPVPVGGGHGHHRR
jgi:hypothetical protein